MVTYCMTKLLLGYEVVARMKSYKKDLVLHNDDCEVRVDRLPRRK
jgi:hypothetical protein